MNCTQTSTTASRAVLVATPGSQIRRDSILGNQGTYYIDPVPYGSGGSGLSCRPIPIGQLPSELRGHVKDQIDWKSVVSVICQHTASQPYSRQPEEFIDFDTVRIYRPNHGAPHHIRQTRVVDIILENLMRFETPFSGEEMNSMRLLSYCYRLGRVNEAHGLEDANMAKRSGQIYREYAKQMAFSESVINWTCSIMDREYGIPLPDGKAEFAFRVIDLAHRLDLQRCYPKEKWMAPQISKIEEDLRILFKDRFNDSLTSYFLEYSASLIVATGNKIEYSGNKNYNPDIFPRMSRDPDYCFDTVNSIPFNYIFERPKQ